MITNTLHVFYKVSRFKIAELINILSVQDKDRKHNFICINIVLNILLFCFNTGFKYIKT